MKKRLLAVVIFLSLGFGGTYAQIQGVGGTPQGFKWSNDLRDIPEYLHETPDVEALRAEDALVDGKGIAPWRFGHINSTSYNFNDHGSWVNIQGGGKIWQLRLTSPQAQTINLHFEQTKIPAGNQLFVYNPKKDFILGAFTQNEVYEGELGTELVPGETVIVEYYVSPENLNDLGSFNITRVVHGYRSVAEYIEKGFGTSGNCNMNVACPDAAPWGNQVNSTVQLVSGSSGFCTGALINNTANDGKPYVLTANHCYSNPASWIFRFNWQSATCANPSSSPTFQSLSGAVLRARRTPSDFCLVEITGGLVGGTVPASYNPYFSGWNRSNTPPTNTFGIHHPDGDIKKISFDDNASSAVQAMGSSEAASSWQVVWDRNTTTEPASSGSPLFDQNGRIIGQLWGGSASCSNLSGPDYYGRVYSSWQPSGSNTTNQLKHWLDPNDSGVDYIDGFNPHAVVVTVDARLDDGASPASSTCSTSFVPSATIKNLGTNALTSATVGYRLNGGAWVNQNWTGNLATGASATITFSAATAVTGNNTLVYRVSNPNASTDLNPVNDSVSKTFTVINTTPVALPIIEGFEGNFVPSGWTLDNPDNSVTWAKFGTAGASSASSARVNNYNYTTGTGQKDYLYTPFFSLLSATQAEMKFDVAYARYNSNTSYYDVLQVEISNNCGSTWTSLYNKSGTALQTTTTTTTSNFVPTANQWRNETISLTPYLNQATLQIRVVSESKYGNNLYIDNINIAKDAGNEPVDPTSLEETILSNMNVWPNPSTDIIHVGVQGQNISSVSLINMVGQKLYTNQLTSQLVQIPVSKFAPGVYFVEVEVNGVLARKKVVIQ